MTTCDKITFSLFYFSSSSSFAQFLPRKDATTTASVRLLPACCLKSCLFLSQRGRRRRCCNCVGILISTPPPPLFCRLDVQLKCASSLKMVLFSLIAIFFLQGTPRSSPGDEVVCFSSTIRGGGGETHEAHLVCPQLTGSTRRRRKDVAPWTAGQEQQ